MTSKHVVTAAHCFQSKNGTASKVDIVRLGEFDQKSKINRKDINIPIDHVDLHENFNTFLVFYTYDIAMVHLKHHVGELTGKLEFYLREGERLSSSYRFFKYFFTLKDHIRPICLPTKEQARSVNLEGKTPYVILLKLQKICLFFWLS